MKTYGLAMNARFVDSMACCYCLYKKFALALERLDRRFDLDRLALLESRD